MSTALIVDKHISFSKVIVHVAWKALSAGNFKWEE
jgi:hypothetical protein